MKIESSKVKIRVEDDAVVILLDAPTDGFLTPWQDAYQIGWALREQALHLPEVFAVDWKAVTQELAQLQVSQKDGVVLLRFAWTDRLRFSKAAGLKMAKTLRMVAVQGQVAQKQLLEMKA